MPALEGYGKGSNRMYQEPKQKRGGRFGGMNEQRAGKPSRGGAKQSAPRLTISDYDKAKV